MMRIDLTTGSVTRGAAAGDGEYVVFVAGDIDMATAATLRDHLDEAVDSESPSIRIDLAEVTFIDSTGLSVLIDLRNRLHDRPLVVSRPRPMAARLIEVVGLTDILHVVGADSFTEPA